MGKAQKQYLNKVAAETKRLIARKAREQTVLAMEDDKIYHDIKFGISLTGSEWKDLIKKDTDE